MDTDRANPMVEFETLFGSRLAQRAPTMRAVAAKLFESAKAANIVESGCLREPGNWVGDGQSTIVLGWINSKLGGTFVSVDNDALAVSVATATVPRATVTQGDSIAFLYKHDQPIHLLYLDSDPAPGDFDRSAHHHLYELGAARHCLSSGALVLVDDSWLVNVDKKEPDVIGKGTRINEFMRCIGATILASGEPGGQVVWILP
jgi:hypothetical protein